MNANRFVRKPLKKLLPLLVLEKIYARRNPITYKYGYKSWGEAKNASSGYSKDSILEKISLETTRMLSHDSGWVRDGFFFDEVQLNYEILSILALQGSAKHSLRVVDFGGGLGTTYFQNHKVLEKFGIKVCWNIIEQTHFVKEGKFLLGSISNLHFYETLEEASVTSTDIVLFSSVLEYLENPYFFLEEIVRLGVKPMGVVIDRSPIDSSSSVKYVVQNVDDSIHEAKLPLQILSRERIIETLSSDYELFTDWESSTQPDPKSVARGMYFLRKY
jgi:putative methyltransferase (TIGR04325 family)